MEGAYDRSLNRYEWFFDNCLSIDQAYYGVRLSYVVEEWAELGRMYPAATDSLAAKLEDSLAALLQTPSVELYHDIVAISGYLDQPQIAVKAFRQLESTDPVIAKRAIHFGWELLFNAEEHTLLAAYIPSASDRYAEILQLLDHSVKAYDPDWGEDYLGWAHETFRNNTDMLVTTLRKTGRVAEANEIIGRAVKDRQERRLT